MKKAFDLYEALKTAGFEEAVNEFGFTVLSKSVSKEVETVWYGTQTSTLTIEALFNSDKTTVRFDYTKDGRSYKTKSHLNEKRAWNAMMETARFAGFDLEVVA